MSVYHKKLYLTKDEIKAGVVEIDVYRVYLLFEVTSHPLAHAIKKLLMPGLRHGKSKEQDLSEAISSIQSEIDEKDREKDREKVLSIPPSLIVPDRRLPGEYETDYED